MEDVVRFTAFDGPVPTGRRPIETAVGTVTRPPAYLSLSHFNANSRRLCIPGYRKCAAAGIWPFLRGAYANLHTTHTT